MAAEPIPMSGPPSESVSPVRLRKKQKASWSQQVKAAPTKDTIVLKVGTSSLVNHKTGCLSVGLLARLAEVIQTLRLHGFGVVIVSSGAIGAGCMRLGRRKRPKTISGRQAMAAIGQVGLMRQYDDLLSTLGIVSAQVLLTYDNYHHRSQYLNAVDTIQELVKMGVVPIINENDTVAVDELRYGDNDTLSAYVANMVGASYLFLLTDVDALYTANPHKDATAKPIRIVQNITALQATLHQSPKKSSPPPPHIDEKTDTIPTMPTLAPKEGNWGTGGMETKISAAKFATSCGIHVVIMSAQQIEKIPPALNTWITMVQPSSQVLSSSNDATNHLLGTKFLAVPTIKKLPARKRWILGLATAGQIYIDSGAVKAVISQRKSLFAVGVKTINGQFQSNEIVSIWKFNSGDTTDDNSEELARARINFSSEEMNKIAGKRSEEIDKLLGYTTPQYVIDRENIVLLPHSSTATEARQQQHS